MALNNLTSSLFFLWCTNEPKCPEVPGEKESCISTVYYIPDLCEGVLQLLQLWLTEIFNLKESLSTLSEEFTEQRKVMS